MGEVPLLGGADDGVGHRVREVLLKAGGKAQHVVLLALAEGDDVHHLRGGAGQGAGLVEDDGVGLGQRFQILAALDGDVGRAALAHGGEDGQRHRELERTGEVHHQDGDGAGDVPGQRVGDHGAREAPRHQLVGQFQRTVLGAGLQLLGFLDHGHDLVVAVGAARSLGQEDALALLHDGARVDGGTLDLPHRHGFAGQRGLIDHGFAFDHGAVQRDHVAGAHHDLVAGLDLRQRQQHFGALAAHPHLVHIQRHAAGQIIEALLAGPLFQQGAEVQQEHDGAGGVEIAPQHRNADAQRIQHLDFQLALEQTFDALPHKGDGAPDGVGRADGGGQEQLAEAVAYHKAVHLFLIFLIEFPAVGGGHKGVQLRPVELVGAQRPDGVGTLAIIIKYHVAGPLVDGGLFDGVVVVEISFQHIGAVERHPHVADMDAHPAPAFMQNGAFHTRSLSDHEKEPPAGGSHRALDYSAASVDAVSSAASSMTAASALAARASLIAFASARMSPACS